jgi:hypothetical protein
MLHRNHDLRPFPQSVEAWGLMQSSLRVFWVWNTSKVGSWQNDWLKAINQATAREKKRPRDKQHQQFLDLQAPGLWWRVPLPSQPLRPVSIPWSCPICNAGQKLTINCFCGDWFLLITGAKAMHIEKLNHRDGSQEHRVLQKMGHQ